MAATSAVVFLWDEQAWIGHVGDCRVLLCHEGRLTQMTRDQTLVNRMVDLGQLSPEEALSHPARNQVAEAVGKQLALQPASYQAALTEGDWLLVASDGLHSQVEAGQVQERLARGAGAMAFANELVDLANRNGGTDNCTVLVVHLRPVDFPG
jgi:protein phosphatase